MAKAYLPLIGVILLVVVLWPYPVLIPLKILVVFFHEASHAIMTVATGGEVVEMVISVDQGGHVLSRGGNRFLTLSAGYLGSLIWGVLIYLTALLSRLDRALMFILGLSLLAIAAWWIRDVFALGFALATGGAMIASAIWLPMSFNDAVLRVIGVTSMLYAPLDIYSDTIERSHLRSDAVMLGEAYGGSGMLWGVGWFLLSLAVIYVAFKFGHRSPPSSQDN
ncbi:conserved hypothetical protein [Hahella chejuensis KCTC 2396]|uniref:Uncharacterized protein n=1 Tax=Hahella chejuensis (strain KCTC 2396) TaxID=349521 RepID=Q2SNZ3_HAHCH|nr:M50 family metallopeptidase [Hahella chejuensis]ABC27631.1 conserved hypothetical protein [Hahella chejuensis KCTC 2396]